MTETFLQFPLCALAFDLPPEERLGIIRSFAAVETGREMFARQTAQQRAQLTACYHWNPPDGYDASNPAHVAARFGAEQIGVPIHYMPGILVGWKQLTAFKSEFESRHGRDPQVRIRTDLFLEALTGKLGYREFAVLCAVYSCIGRKSYPVRITREQIRRRMLGYKSEAVMGAEFGNREYGPAPLTWRQVGYALDRLHERQFFARARANKRQTFFSNRLTQQRLEEALFSSQTHSPRFHERRRQREAALMARIQAAKPRIKADTRIKVDNGDVH